MRVKTERAENNDASKAASGKTHKGKKSSDKNPDTKKLGAQKPNTKKPGIKAMATAKNPAMPQKSDEKKGQRIAKLLARAGIASRREIERMIAAGRISINGNVLDTPATILDDLKGVTVDGNPVGEVEPARLWRFNKPRGCLTTEFDPKGRKTIYDVLKKTEEPLPRIMPIGRLDMNTEGLLLMTNDGELKRFLELPANGVERRYRARSFGDVTQKQLEDLIHGITIDGINYGKINAHMERSTGRNQWINMTLREGKNREVRNVLGALGLEVSRLIRTDYGYFNLADLEPGEIKEVPASILHEFRKGL